MEGVVTSVLSPHCYQTFFVEHAFLDGACVRLLLSKLLSYQIVAASIGLKVPQILQIVRAKSGAGISLVMYQLEIIVYTLTVAYFYLSGYSFSAYGDCFFILLQDLIVFYLILYYEGNEPSKEGDNTQNSSKNPENSTKKGDDSQNSREKETESKKPAVKSYPNPSFFPKISAYAAAYAVLVGFLFSPYAPLNQLYSLTIPIAILSRVPQIYKNFRESGVGNLNVVTFSLNTVGAMTRIFTTLSDPQLRNDTLVLAGYIMSSSLNGAITAQIIYYNYVVKKVKKD